MSSVISTSGTDVLRRYGALEPLAWCCLVLAVVLLGHGSSLNVALAAVSLAFGARVLIGHGRRVTTLGLFNFSCALFIGYAGMVAALDRSSPVSNGYLTLAIAGPLAVQIITSFVAWRDSAESRCGRLSRADARWAVVCGVVGMIVLEGVQALIPEAAVFVEGGAFMCVVVVAVGVALHEDSSLSRLDNLVTLAVFGFYAIGFQGGTGRLRLVAALCAVVTVYTFRYPLRRLKVAMVAFTPVALYALAQQRLSYQESLVSGASAGRSGLESMLTPVVVLGQLMQGQSAGTIPPSYGLSFLSIPFAVVPRSLTPEWVPEALGYSLVEVIEPERAGTGFSLAATAFGEWVFNFGLLGLIVMVPVLALTLRLLDRRVEAAMAAVDGRRGVLRVAFWSMLGGSIADIAWSGLHTWAARATARLPILLVLLVFTSRRGRGPVESLRSAVTTESRLSDTARPVAPFPPRGRARALVEWS